MLAVWCKPLNLSSDIMMTQITLCAHNLHVFQNIFLGIKFPRNVFLIIVEGDPDLLFPGFGCHICVKRNSFKDPVVKMICKCKLMKAMSWSQIAEMVAIYKKSAAISTTYELNKIISEHSNMLDCRKKKSYYTEEQMRKLVDDEFNCLDLLMNVFSSGISSNREEIVFSILSLAQMLSVSLRYFDELYYFDNKEAIGNGDRWQISHVKWVGIYDKLSSGDFIEQLQDFGMFEMNLSTVETDCFCVSFYDQIRSLKQDIEDNQSMIVAVDDKELFRSIVRQTNEEARREIESVLREADVPLDQCKEFVQVAVGA